MKFNLDLSSITDIYIRENFKKLQDLVNSISAIIGLTPISTQITLKDTQIEHNLSYTPVDLIQTSFQNSDVTIQWLYEKFDGKFLYFKILNAPVDADATKYVLNILVGRLS